MPSIFDSLSLDTAHVADTLSVMIQKEQRCCCTNYFDKYSLSESVHVDVNARVKMVDWCYEIVDQCELDRECVAMAMNMVDQFLSKPNVPAQVYLSSPKEYQLLAITALYTSIKIHEPTVIGPDVFAAISNGMYSVQDVEKMEVSLLMGLQWKIYTPTSLQMAYHILSFILPRTSLSKLSWDYLLDEVLFQTEFAVRDYELSAMSRPSTVALASILNALGEMDDDQARQKILRALVFVIDEFGRQLASPRELMDTRNRLQSLIEHEDSVGHEEDDDQTDECDYSSTLRRPDSSYTDVRECGMVDDSPPEYVYIG